MNRRRVEMLENVMEVVGDERWDLIVNDYHKGDDDFDYAIIPAGTGISMNRINLGDDKIKVAMLLALDRAIIDNLKAQGQYEEEEGE